MGQDVSASSWERAADACESADMSSDRTEEVSRQIPRIGNYMPPPELADIVQQWAWTRGYISMYEVLGWLKAEYTRGVEEGRRMRR